MAVGIVAEYDPFHLGHAYQISAVRERFGDVPVVAAVSSDFTQRGVPAFCDKWTRAKAAVMCGVDLVLELPLPFCCSNAGVFANAAMEIFAASGVVDSVSFGMENPDLASVDTISSILVHEADTFKADLQFFLGEGFSFASSRARALERSCAGAGELLRQPNNSLAVEYVTAAKRLGCAFGFFPVERIGAGFRDTGAGGVMSASGVRAALRRGDLTTAFSAMPKGSAEVLRGCLENGRCSVDLSPLWNALRLLFFRSGARGAARFSDMTEGIESRFVRAVEGCGGFDELVERVATRRYPKSRVRRTLISFLLGVEKEDAALFQSRGVPYLRPLAMSARGRALLRDMRKCASLPVVLKPAALRGDDYAQRVMSLGVRGARIWEGFVGSPDFRREITAVPFIAG